MQLLATGAVPPGRHDFDSTWLVPVVDTAETYRLELVLRLSSGSSEDGTGTCGFGVGSVKILPMKE